MEHVHAAGAQAAGEGLAERGGAEAAIVADGHARAACAGHDGAEAAADGERVRIVQRAADHAADVVFAQAGRVEVVLEGGHLDQPCFM